MKISTFITSFLVVSAVFFVFALMASDIKTYYPDESRNTSEWEGQYEFQDNITHSVDEISEPLKNLGDEEKGWILRTISGVAAIPAAVIALISIVFKSFLLGTTLVTGIFTTIGLPMYLIAIVIAMISIWGVSKLLETIQRWPI